MDIINKQKMGNKIKIIVIVLIVLTLFFMYLNNDNQKKLDKKKNEPTQVLYKDVIIGTDTKEIVSKKLGNPINITTNGDSELYEFESNNPNFSNELLFKSDTLSFVKEIIAPMDNIDIQTIKAKYGEANSVLYPPGAGMYTGLFIYLDDGVAYRGNYFTGDITEMWYFKPTDIDNFKNLYAPNYSNEPQIGQ